MPKPCLSLVTTLMVVLLAASASAQSHKKFQKMLPQETKSSGFSVVVQSEPGTDETNLNDNIRFTLSGSNMKNTIHAKATSKAQLDKEFGRIATETLADLGLKPQHAGPSGNATYAGDMSAVLELGSGGWVFVPKDADSFRRLVGMVKYLGVSREGDLKGTVTQLKVSLMTNDLRFGSGEAAFMPKIKVLSSGSFKAGSTSMGTTLGSMNQDSSGIEKTILAAFRKRCFDDQARTIETLADVIGKDTWLPADGKAQWCGVLTGWAKVVREGKPRTQLLSVLDEMKKKASGKAGKDMIAELAKTRDYICESAITIDVRYL